MSKRSAHGYVDAEITQSTVMVISYPNLKLPLLVVLLFTIHPLFWISQPTFEVASLERHKSSNEECNGVFDKRFGENWNGIDIMVIDNIIAGIPCTSVPLFRTGDHCARESLNNTMACTTRRVG